MLVIKLLTANCLVQCTFKQHILDYSAQTMLAHNDKKCWRNCYSTGNGRHTNQEKHERFL